MKTIFYLLLCLSLWQCDLIQDDENEAFGNIPDQELNAEFSIIYSTGAIAPEIYRFESASWNSNGIVFEGSTQPGQGKKVSIRDLNVNGTGQFGVLNDPYALITAENHSGVYSTRTTPNFWINPPNNHELILGGSGFSASDYLHDPGSVVQGGYINITNHNERYIAGEFYLVGWVYHNQLNREVMWGIYCNFRGVPYTP
jgi:hypothetical protein